VARITIEDCLKRVENRFLHIVAKRVRQIREGSDYLVSSPKNEDIVVSLREVAAGKVVSPPAELQDEAAESFPIFSPRRRLYFLRAGGQHSNWGEAPALDSFAEVIEYIQGVEPGHGQGSA
jgi:DNA-directed RNA polymerase subunit omega